MRALFNGRTSAFQADYAGSIPVARSIENTSGTVDVSFFYFMILLLKVSLKILGY